MASYYVWSGATGSANGTSWANAYTTLTLAFALGKVAGDIFYVAHDHAESTAGTVTLDTNGTLAAPVQILCVNRSGSVPPVSADLRTTGQVTAASGNALNFRSHIRIYGLIFNGVCTVQNQDNASTVFTNCSLRLNTSSAANIAVGGSGNVADYVELNNTTVSFQAVNQTVSVAGRLVWRNTLSAVIGTAVPDNLFTFIASRAGSIECIGVDFSALGSGKTLVSQNANTTISARFVDCKLHASVTKTATPTSAGAGESDFIRSGSAGVNYAVLRQRAQGLLTEETTIVRTGGASDGTTAIAWKVITTANCTYSLPFECPPIAIWHDTTGSAKTATVEGIWGGGAVPNDDDIWLDLEYLGDAASPQGSFVNDGKADLLATAAGQTSSSATWGGSTTKFKLGVTFTAQQKGWIYARVKCAKASSTFYIDPLITLT